MAKKGQIYKTYSSEFKISVIMDMREHHLDYRETVRKYWNISRGQDLNYVSAEDITLIFLDTCVVKFN